MIMSSSASIGMIVVTTNAEETNAMKATMIRVEGATIRVAATTEAEASMSTVAVRKA
jgi:hypothetical protein